MKNLSLLLLVLAALQIDLFSSNLLYAAQRAKDAKGGKGGACNAWPTNAAQPSGSKSNSLSTPPGLSQLVMSPHRADSADSTLIQKQPSASHPASLTASEHAGASPALDRVSSAPLAPHPMLRSIEQAPSFYVTRGGRQKDGAITQLQEDFTAHSHRFTQAVEAPDVLPSHARRKYVVSNSPDAEKTIVEATTKDQLSSEDRALYEAGYASIMRQINDYQNSHPYVTPADETVERKNLFNPVVADIKKCGDALSQMSRTQTKGHKSGAATTSSLPSEKSPYTLFIKTTDKSIRTQTLPEITGIMARKQVDPYAIETESSRTVANCGQSIIEGSRVSDLDRTATAFALTTEDKTRILQTKRIAEFATVLTQLEGYARARNLEETSQARFAELEARATELEGRLERPITEKDRIETERALLTINREKAGIAGQLAGAKKDRSTKNNAIFVARTESGSLKAFLGRFGARTAEYVSNPQDTPLMVEELFSKVLPELDEIERKKQAAAFLDILLGKTKPAPARLTWTGQQSVKTNGNYPDFSYVIEGHDLSGKRGTERIPHDFALELSEKPESPVSILQQSPLLPLIALYTKRAGIDQELVNIPHDAHSLEHFHAKRFTREKRWEFNPFAQTWEKKMQESASVSLAIASPLIPSTTVPGDSENKEA